MRNTRPMKIAEALGNLVIVMASTCAILLVIECGSGIFYEPPARAMSFSGPLTFLQSETIQKENFLAE